MSFNAEFNLPVPIISKYIKFTIRFRIEHIDQLFSLKEPFDTILNGTKNDNTRLVQYFPPAINKISISISSKKEKKIHQTSSNMFEPIPSIPNIAKFLPRPHEIRSNRDQRRPTRSNPIKPRRKNRKPSFQRAHKPENNYFRINAASNEGEIDSRLIEHIIQGRRCVFARGKSGIRTRAGATQ